jgi:hypothetical protein
MAASTASVVLHAKMLLMMWFSTLKIDWSDHTSLLNSSN